MSARAARRLAWSLWALMLALAVGQMILTVLNRDTELPEGADVGLIFHAVSGLAVGSFATVGALVASRRPANPIGWILVAGGMALAASGLAEAYGVHALYTDSGGLPGGAIAAWIAAWVYIPAPVPMPALLFLLFPDGRLLGPRWRWVLWLVAVGAVAAMMGEALGARLGDAPFEGVANPLPLDLPDAVRTPIGLLGWPAMVLGLLLAAAAMILRLRRSRGIERQQLKWMAAAAAILPPVILLGVIGYFAGLEEDGGILVILAFLPIPLAAGYAILRHRLYDVGLVINRALVYGSLTALLAGAYFGLVLLLGLALSPLTSQSDLAIAISVLVVAALFQPVRRRLQHYVDRRFYRRRYDAARTLERFSARLQSQTDLEALQADLAGVVRQTMQPAHVSVWVREGRR